MVYILGFFCFLLLIGLAFLIYILILKLINKLFLKDRKIDFKEFFIGWCIVFVINLFAVFTDTPFAIGLKVSPYSDGGETSRYYSLGYIVTVRKALFPEHSPYPKPTSVYFFNFEIDEY